MEGVIESFDVMILGAGLVGQTLAIGLDRLGYRVGLIESRPFEPLLPNQDLRAIALSYGSIEFLKKLSLWEPLNPMATQIHQVHVSEKGGFAQCRIDREGLNLAYLGQVLDITDLLNGLMTELRQTTRVSVLSPYELKDFEVESRILILENKQTQQIEKYQADWILSAEGAGMKSQSDGFCFKEKLGIKIQEKNFNQIAIVGNILLRDAHENKAYERFTETGPLALLPLSTHKATFIWALTPEKSEQLMSVSDENFLKELQNCFGYRAGYFEKIFKRTCYELTQKISAEVFKENILLMGNAAHALHPIAGQGFNLTLKDMAELLKQIKKYGLKDDRAFQIYLQVRTKDQQEIAAFSEKLADLFTRKSLTQKLFRNIGLHVLERQPGLKKYLAERLAGIV